MQVHFLLELRLKLMGDISRTSFLWHSSIVVKKSSIEGFCCIIYDGIRDLVNYFLSNWNHLTVCSVTGNYLKRLQLHEEKKQKLVQLLFLTIARMSSTLLQG